MAKILPAEASPPPVAIERRHAPKTAGGKKGYQRYRNCLRWDFGFTCPFCLQHEADIEPRGVEGTGNTTVEHRQLQKDEEDDTTRNEYGNCLYACKYCNRDRHIADLVDTNGRVLLDPTQVVWSEHFELRNDQLVAVAGDPNADYTVESYKPNQPRKVTARRSRRKRITQALDNLAGARERERQLIEIASRQKNVDDRRTLIQHARALRSAREQLRKISRPRTSATT